GASGESPLAPFAAPAQPCEDSGAVSVSVKEYLAEKQAWIDREIETRLPPAAAYPPRLHDAIRYTALLPGKRLRPIVCLASGAMFGADEADLIPAACAIEMVHA